MHKNLHWILLVLISTSVTFSTLHSHHHLEWDHVHHTETGQCLVDNSNICPVCGYLFGAQTMDPFFQSAPIEFAGYIANRSETVRAFVPGSRPTDRAPPVG